MGIQEAAIRVIELIEVKGYDPALMRVVERAVAGTDAEAETLIRRIAVEVTA